MSWVYQMKEKQRVKCAGIMSNKNLEEGKTLGGKWHPNKEEKEYLKRKKG